MTNILGVSCRTPNGSTSIILNERLAGRRAEPFVMAHEAFHVADEFRGCGNVAMCGEVVPNDDTEIAAWLGPALFMVDERLLPEIRRDGPIKVAAREAIPPALVSTREQIAVLLGDQPGDSRAADLFVRSAANHLSSWTFLVYREANPPTIR